jgi:hypothetical protein
MVYMKCKAVTRRNKPCPIPVEVWRKGEFCHVHDPHGNYRQQHPYSKKKPKKQFDKGRFKQTLILEMSAKKCTSDPNHEYCLSENAIHCETIDYMIDLVSEA